MTSKMVSDMNNDRTTHGFKRTVLATALAPLSLLGVSQAMAEEPSVVYDAVNFSYDPKHHDPRGRIYYARIKYAF